MTKPRPVREVKRMMRAAGFAKKRQSGSHATWQHKVTGHKITLIEKGDGRDMSPAMVAAAIKTLDDVEREMQQRENGTGKSWVDVNEAAKLLGVSHTTVRTLRDRGSLVGRKRRVPGQKREKWFIEMQSIQDYQGRGPAQPAKILLSARLREVEEERDALKTQLEDLRHDKRIALAARNQAWTEAELLKKERDEAIAKLEAPRANPGLLELQKRLNSPEVRFLLGQGPTLEEVFESVVTRGLESINEQLTGQEGNND
jgi:predicted RNA binding protein YcfA (HicA-like mRNA interferase family)/DNA-binding transcriptional MerR regulator